MKLVLWNSIFFGLHMYIKTEVTANITDHPVVNTTALNRRQHADIADSEAKKLTTLDPSAQKNQGVIGQATRFTMPPTTTMRYHRSTPRRYSFTEDCDYLAQYCLKAYDTGQLCGRTLYYNYYTFKNYCLLDYVNCMERYELWQVVHMGECFTIKALTEYIVYPYHDDYFLDQYYIMEDN